MDISRYVVDLHGKAYLTVAGRILLFWELAKDKNAGITTEVTQDGNVIQVKAFAHIEGRGANGHASEVIGGAGVNRTNALENAETSAVGRALGMLGIGLLEAGGVASADEVQMAIAKGTTPQAPAVQQPQQAGTEFCPSCNGPISQAEVDFSRQRFGQIACRNCQANLKPVVARRTAPRT